MARISSQYECNRRSAQARYFDARFAESRGLSEYSMRKLKAFVRYYDQRELDQLGALRRPNGLPQHWVYVGYLSAR